MMQTERPKWGQWQSIEKQISRDIASGALAPRSQLPTELEIMQRFGVGRHTVRRAIAELAAAGKVRSNRAAARSSRNSRSSGMRLPGARASAAI